MRRITAILLLLGMLLAVGVVGAQEEEIRLFINNRIDIQADSYHQYIEILGTNLRRDGYSLVLIEDIEDSNLILHIQRPFFRENAIEILLETKTFPVFPETDILYSAPESSIELAYALDENSLATNLNNELNQYILEYLALYSIGECLATPSQEQIREYREFLPTGKTMDFYVGNCALLENDIDTAYSHLSQSASYTIQPFINDQHALVNLAWLYVTYGFEWRGFEGWNYSEASPVELIGYYECERFEGPCWASNDTNITSMATRVIPVEKQIELISKRARLYALAFDYDSAIADMDEVIFLAEKNELDNTTLAELYTIRGQIVFLLYEWDRVLADFNHAIELDPNYAPAYFERGVLYYTMTQRENALADFERYLELEPDGLYAEEATQYIDSIQFELEALGG